MNTLTYTLVEENFTRFKGIWGPVFWGLVLLFIFAYGYFLSRHFTISPALHLNLRFHLCLWGVNNVLFSLRQPVIIDTPTVRMFLSSCLDVFLGLLLGWIISNWEREKALYGAEVTVNLLDTDGLHAKIKLSSGQEISKFIYLNSVKVKKKKDLLYLMSSCSFIKGHSLLPIPKEVFYSPEAAWLRELLGTHNVKGY